MRISVSDGYFHGLECPLEDCDRRYCNEHRLLWRDCDTAKEGHEGDRDVIGGLNVIYDLGDCPECERAYRRMKYAAMGSAA